MSREPDANLEFSRVTRKFYRGFAVATGLLCVAVAIVFIEGRELKAIAIAGACFCAFYAAYCIWEIRDQSPGLVIDSQGLVVNTGSTPMDRIPWSDITGFRIHEFAGHRFVAVDFVDTQKYVERRGWSRSTARLVTELAGSRVDFDAESIGLAPEELLRVLNSARDSFAGAQRGA